MPKNFVSNKDETVRMFKSDFMEALSKVHPAVPVIIFLPAISYFLYLSIFEYEFRVITIIPFFLLGILIWTFTEYTLHRFIFHYEPENKIGKRIHFIFHGVHHDYPNDSRRLVMPPSVSIPLATLLYFIFYFLIGDHLVSPFFSGFLTGYLFYDMLHYAVHHYNMHHPFWLALKNYHMKHHYMDANRGYGVSSPLWDVIIGTEFPKTKTKENLSKETL